MILALLLIAAPASPPAIHAIADFKIRVIHGHNKTNTLDPKINDLFGLLKTLAYSSYELKQQSEIELQVDGDKFTQALLGNRHLTVMAKNYRAKKNKGQVQLEIEIPELMFKTKASVMSGATLVIGGPKFEDGVLFFAVTATAIVPTTPASAPIK